MGLQLKITRGDLAWAKEAVKSTLIVFPTFCREGVGYGLDKTCSPFEPYDENLAMVVIARCWLGNFRRAKTCSRAHSSYGCKHGAERWAGHYVSNAALIAAACGLGIEQKRTHFDSPNTYLAISYGSWKCGFDSKYDWMETSAGLSWPPIESVSYELAEEDS